LFDRLPVLAPREFGRWASNDLASQPYRVRHLYAAVTKAHSELWWRVGVWFLVVLDTTATQQYHIS
jgi:hypothetical protein